MLLLSQTIQSLKKKEKEIIFLLSGGHTWPDLPAGGPGPKIKCWAPIGPPIPPTLCAMWTFLSYTGILLNMQLTSTKLSSEVPKTVIL